MKNILILSSDDDIIFENIIKHFADNKEMQFKLLCNNSNSSILKKAEKLKIETFVIEEYSDIETFFENRKFDLVAVLNFNKILSEKVLETNTFINVHPSILPKYRGLRAIDRAFINRDLTTGITFHYINKYLNEGEIIYQKEIEINFKWSIKKLEKEIKELIKFYYPRVIEKFFKTNVLVIASGSKENVIVEKIINSEKINKIYTFDFNDTYCGLSEKISYQNNQDLINQIKKKNIQLVIVEDEEYLDSGIVDVLNKFKIRTVGIDKKNAKFESSKFFAKKIMQKYGIKTASCKKINNAKDIDDFILFFKNPIIKADGLTRGLGVYENQDIEKTKHELFKFLSGKYGQAGKTSLIEQKLNGFKATLYSMWDGDNLLHLPLCQSIKKNSQGLYTAGLGTICPLKLNQENEEKLAQYKDKLAKMLKGEKIISPCVFCSELMVCDDDIYVIEYNVRFSSPDIEVLANYIKNDWFDIFYSCANKMLNSIVVEEDDTEKIAIVLVNKGYPLKTRTNVEIKNIENVNDFIKMYFSNIIKRDGKFYSNGSRILSVVSSDRNAIYKYLKQIDFEDKDYRIDIVLKNKQ